MPSVAIVTSIQCTKKVMEFAFDVTGVLPNEITRSAGAKWLGHGRSRNERDQQLAAIVNKLGAASAKAQGLRVAVTTYQKLVASSHTLYLLRDTGEQPAVIGLLKIGRKNLFLSDPLGVQREVKPLCVLDFYIHESRQRSGHGRRLFEAMLKMEGVKVKELAIDRPSAKLLSFLKKHYKLQSYVKQGNNFVVFDQFFQSKSGQSFPHHPLAELIPSTTGNSTVTTRTASPRDVPGSCTSAQPAVSPPTQADPPPRATPSHKLPSASSKHSTLTTPHHHRLPATPPHHRLPSSHNSTFNWSPDIVLLRQQGRKRDIQCNVITGAPLQSAGGWRVSQGQRWQGDSEQEGEVDRERRAPLLTLRDRGKPQRSERLRERSTAGTISLELQGFHLAGGQPPATSRTGSSTYSRHPHPLQASSPQSLSVTAHRLSGVEHKTERWRQADS